ncbi:two-component sensor histidine kinase [Bacillus pseudomycoides]|nr:two-component sensor histidine kinase [Bacillus pseudomycoides]
MIRKFVLGSVTRRIFLITTGLLVMSALLIYLLLYFLLPSFYYQYKQNNLNKNVNIFVEKVKGESFKDVKAALERYSSENKDVICIVSDRKGTIVYTPSIYVPDEGNVSTVDEVPAIPVQSAVNITGQAEEKNQQSPSIYTIKEEVQLQEGGYQFTFYTYLYPIEEISRVLLSFSPYIIAIIIVISIVGSLFYSKILAKPLIDLNKVARRMAKLDFSQKSSIKSNDELGELSTTLNDLANNLQQTMIQLKNSNEMLKDDIKKERELDAKRRQFLTAISHDLKTPIAVVKGQLEGMLYNIGVYKDRDRYLQKSYETMNSMEGLVKEILELSRLESERLQLNKENANLSIMIERIIQEHEYFRYSKQLKVVKFIEKNLYYFSDTQLLKKVIQNILHNAYSYTQEGKEVYVSLYRRNDEIILEILNTGAYIEEEHLEHIFEPFYRTEKSRNRNTGGNGLGLFIVQQLLDAHKIQYSLKNTKKGVLFTICFK